MSRHSIDDQADALDIPAAAREPRGFQAMKIDPERIEASQGSGRAASRGRVVLVSAITPTPAGEGKTTTSVGLTDGLRRRGVRAVAALRQPSLGPVFGAKGGAVGGGKAMLVPQEGINLHFTGDIHAVSSAHALLSALLDNHLHHQNEPRLPVERVTWGRAQDMNDRALRTLEVGLSAGGPRRKDRTDITAASEVMAVFCMAKDVSDLRARLGRIVVGTLEDGSPVTAESLQAAGPMAALLLDAARPNLVRTLEGSPALVHGGPFANVAQGTSTLIQTQLARRLADVVVTEGGFAFDLGGFKFIDLQCRAGGFRPGAIVLVATVRALRFQGGATQFAQPDPAAVEKGLENLVAHLDSVRRLGLPAPIVAINRFPGDAPEELALLKRAAQSRGSVAVEALHFAQGGAGAEELADAVMAQLERDREDSPGYRAPYDAAAPLPEKIAALAQTLLGAGGIEFSVNAQGDLARLERAGLDRLPLCLAKTHLSISDDAAVRGRPAPFVLRVTGLRAAAGAGFVVVLCGPILTMPGLAARPAANGVDIERDAAGRWRVRGLQ